MQREPCSIDGRREARAGADGLKPVSPVVHIVVVGIASADRELSARDTLEALHRLGPEVSIDTHSNIEPLVGDLEVETIDLFVLDCQDGLEATRWLDILGKLAPPVLRVLRDDDDESALDSFRRGAAQCVRVGEDYANVLPAAALELIHRWQRQREREQLERQLLQSEKMASIGQLAAGVAHEINNPVGFIAANLFQLSEYLEDLQGVWERLQTLQDTIDDGRGLGEIRAASDRLRQVCREIDFDYVKQDLVKAVNESREGSERIRHIVRDLRDFSRQDSGETSLADVNRCIDTTANIVWTMMKHVVILKKDYAELPRLRCFPKQLEQVLMNLLVNACQAIEEKGGESGTVGEVEVRTLRRNGGVAIIIRDTGVGISPENLDRIFEPFFTTKDIGAGTGLGLSTSYSIIARHGGEIRVESEVGKGTTFDVWLPQGVEPEARIAD